MTKIVFVLPYFLPAIGGVITHVLYLATELIKEGYEVEIHASNSLQHKVNFFTEGKVSLSDSLHIVYERELFPRIVRQLRNVKIPADADIVHLHNFDRALATLTILKARRLKRPIIVTPHGALMSVYDITKPYILATRKREYMLVKYRQVYDKFISARLLNQVDKMIALCHKEEKILVKHLDVDPSKVNVIPNFVPSSIFNVNVDIDSIDRKDVRKIVEEYNENYIITISRIDQNKGLDLVVRTLAKVPDIHYVIVGPDNGYLHELISLSDRLGVRNRLHYLGTIYDLKTKIVLLRHAKIFALPSRVEVFPISVLEAMSQGVPVITVSSGCLPEIIQNGVDGFVCEYRSDFGKYIQMLIEDDNLRRYICLKAKEKVYRNYSLDIVKDKLLRIYKEIAGEH